ncbi:MAG: hypothetical protein A3K18_07735 [Lentisphaerae bacterium RIFOXYA12_64_32]|nr:MAG: hypothetical protein A3K18_07735 [Lentisphaerae bacterium RIFOXYA12_64_32]
MATSASQLSAPEYDVILAPNVRAPLHDGVKLATDIYLPARGCDRVPGRFPALLIRTPYNKEGSRGVGEFYARRGYVLAAQDVRGRYQSEGEFYGFRDEGPDGYDAVEWVAAQSWCDGKVGTFGASYCAAVQSALASFNPPHLAAMIVQFGPSSYFHSAMRQNGALEMRFLVYAFSMAASSKEALADPVLRQALEHASAHVWDYLHAGPIRKGTTPLRLVPSYEQWAIDLQTHVTYDEHWKHAGFGPRPHYDRHADVPTLYIGGWYDTYTRSTVENFIALRARQKRPVHLLMGPWTHGGAGVPEAGDLSFLPDGGARWEPDIQLPWFDQWLKGRDTGRAAAAPVRYFVMGAGTEPVAADTVVRCGGEWREAQAWPPAGTTLKPFFLHPDSTLRTTAPAAGADSETTFLFDPANPVPTIGGNLSAMPLPAGGFDQRGDRRFPGGVLDLPLSARADVLSFVTEPLEADLEIVGPVRAQLFVSSTAPDTDFTAKLIDVWPTTRDRPTGAAIGITDSIGRLRFRDGYESEKLATPGEICELSFELYPTACRFRKGHRIRVDISSSNYPRFDLNPNTGGPLGQDLRRRTAENTVHHSAKHPSCLVLSVVG